MTRSELGPPSASGVRVLARVVRAARGPGTVPDMRRLALGFALADVLIGALVLAGWAARVPDLTSVLPGLVAAKANSGLALILAGAAVALLVRSPGGLRSWLVWLLALAVLAIAAVTLYEHVAGAALPIDELLARDASARANPHPGRMAGQTALAFGAAAAAILLLRVRIAGRHPAQVLALVTAVISATSLLGYLYGAEQLVALGSATQIALAEAAGLLLLSLAILAANPEFGLVRLLADRGVAGQVSRRILPAAILVVPIGGWLRLEGQQLGLYDEALGVAIMATFEAGVLVLILAWTAASVYRLEGRRARAETERDRFFELTGDLVGITDPDGRLLFVSPSWERILGRPLDAIVGRSFLDFVDPADRAATMARFGLEGSGRSVEGFRNRLTAADGAVRWLEWTSRPDTASGQVYAVGRDVSERQRGEAARARLAAIVESSVDGVFATNEEDFLTDWNASCERIFGYTAAEAIGQHATMTSPEEERAEQRRRYAEAGQGKPQVYEAFRQRKDGTIFRAQLSMFPMYAPDGRFLGLSTIVRDVTEAYEARARLERYAADLARSNAELEQFAYVASHDLQEPLRMVTGFVGLLQKRYGERLGPDADEYIGYAVEGAHRMQNLINDLLAYSRVGTRGAPAEPVELREVVEAALLNLRVALEESGATVHVDELPAVRADRQQMIQLYQNLVANALKFRSDRPPEVWLDAHRERRAWRLSVRDNGIGIAPEHRDQIFVIFRRLHSREAYPGSGIGLAICKKIVERHGGRIGVESSPGEGSTFWFTIPDPERSASGR